MAPGRQWKPTVEAPLGHRAWTLGPPRTLGPPTIRCNYWTKGVALGTFDHHDAGSVDVQPAQNIADRWEPPTMARRNRAEIVVPDEVGVYHCVQRVVRGPSSAGSIPSRAIRTIIAEPDSGPPGVARRALRRGDRSFRCDVKPPPCDSAQPARCGRPLVRSGGRDAVAGPLPGPRGDQAGSRLRPGCLCWANGREGPIDIA